MLVLSRKENEEIVIGDNVSIRILGVAGSKVRLGISAPEFVRLRRAELELTSTAACNPPRPVADRPVVVRCR